MKKVTIVFAVAGFLLCPYVAVAIEGQVAADAPEKAKESSETVIVLPAGRSGTAQTVVDRTLESQGLYFTPGGVRPVEQLGTPSYPEVGEGVILLTPKQKKEEGR